MLNFFYKNTDLKIESRETVFLLLPNRGVPFIVHAIKKVINIRMKVLQIILPTILILSCTKITKVLNDNPDLVPLKKTGGLLRVHEINPRYFTDDSG